MSVKADYPVNIEFIGSDTGSVTINSTKDVIINSSIVNNSGTTKITSTTGSISKRWRPALTPWLLARVADMTGGASVRANVALIVNNARFAGQLAAALAGMK